MIPELAMRRVLGRFLTGVAVVTTLDEGAPHGMTVNSLTSVSLDPPLLLVCLANAARTTDAVRRSGRLAISILSSRQERLALRFARRGTDHFGDLPLVYGRGFAVPIVPDALAHLECTVAQIVPAGDHQVVIARIHHLDDREGTPLGFLRGSFCRVTDHAGAAPLWFS